MRLKMGWRHVAVVVTVAACAAVVGAGLVGPAVGTERITAFDVDVTVRDDGGVEVREVIDWDFGVALTKHGIFRDIPTDAGVPEEIRVSSPTAPDDTEATFKGTDLSIRIGDPDVTVRGRHRYLITYVLPTLVDGDRFALDAIGGGWPVPIERARITVRGVDLARPRCFTGVTGSTDRCPIERRDDRYVTVIDDLGPNEGVTIDGDITARTAAAPAPAPPALVPRDESARARWAGIVAALGLVVGLVVFVASRRVGRNEVAAGGATEAAFAGYGGETFGLHHDLGGDPAPPVPGTRLVADSAMADLAGFEFVPPAGVEPWQASVVLHERIDGDTIGAWFSGQAARDVITFSTRGDAVTMGPGPAAPTADPATADILNRALQGRHALTLGSYDPVFSKVWNEVGGTIGAWSRTSGTFRHGAPSAGLSQGNVLGLVLGLGLGAGIPALIGLGFLVDWLVGLQTAFAAVLLALLVPGVVALAAYRRLVRSLSAKGSALLLRTEAFRRFLHDSEAQHVEWAWEHGLLREYSAWAVALGEARAWNKALVASGVPPVDQDASHSVLAPSTHSSSFSSSHTAPSSSGSSGGGSSGGGGGGGGGGSW